MSKIAIITFGTYGDVAPFVGLGTALRASGFEVALASQEPYRELVTEAGLEYRFLPKDTEQATRESAFAQELIDGARMKPSRTAMRQMVEQLQGVGPAMVAASEGADLLLACGPVGTLFGYHIAEAMGIPSAALHLQPLARTAEFAPPVLTLRSFGRLGNMALWKLGALGEKIYLQQINELRTEMGLDAVRLRDFQGVRDARWPMLFGFSEHIVPRPRDWPPGLEITGYWWPPSPRSFSPPTELGDFLAAGPPPVFVGFGSTATNKGAQLSRIVADAAARTGVRLVLQSGWSQLEYAGDDVLTIGSVPHAWLFPRMSALVHHAGAGTTAAGLRAGVPAIPVPGIMDQPYWSRRLVDLGVAPGSRPRRDLDADWLAEAIRAAVNDPRYRIRAQKLSGALTAEDGGGAVVKAVQRLLGKGVARSSRSRAS
jgi:UDP:flavonoid glycosyltransferase YjiC (YdhE family)